MAARQLQSLGRCEQRFIHIFVENIRAKSISLASQRLDSTLAINLARLCDGVPKCAVSLLCWSR